MKRAALGLAAVAVGAAAGACSAPATIGVPVHEEPRHQLVSDLDFAQVLDVRILGNDTTLFHTHSRPIAYVCLGGSEVAAQVAGDEWNPPGQPCRVGTSFSSPGYAETPLTHRVANTGIDMFHLIGVQNLRQGGSPAATGRAVGSTLVENDWFHVQSIDIDPGAGGDAQAAPRHDHAVPTLLVLIGDVSVSSVDPRGRENILVEHSAWTWIDAGSSHALVSLEGAAARVVEVEVR